MRLKQSDVQILCNECIAKYRRPNFNSLENCVHRKRNDLALINQSLSVWSSSICKDKEENIIWAQKYCVFWINSGTICGISVEIKWDAQLKFEEVLNSLKGDWKAPLFEF